MTRIEMEKLARDIVNLYAEHIHSQMRQGLVSHIEAALTQVRNETIEECAKVAQEEKEMRLRLWAENGEESNRYRAYGALAVEETILALSERGEL